MGNERGWGEGGVRGRRSREREEGERERERECVNVLSF